MMVLISLKMKDRDFKINNLNKWRQQNLKFCRQAL